MDIAHKFSIKLKNSIEFNIDEITEIMIGEGNGHRINKTNISRYYKHLDQYLGIQKPPQQQTAIK